MTFSIAFADMAEDIYDGTYDIKVTAIGHVVAGHSLATVDSTNYYVAGDEHNTVTLGTISISTSEHTISYSATPAGTATLSFAENVLSGSVYVSVRTTDNGAIGATAATEGDHSTDAVAVSINLHS